jgi:hypothetical protein
MSDTKKKQNENPLAQVDASAAKESRKNLESASAPDTAAELRIVCLHRGLEEDLMFRESMIQHLERVPSRPPMILVAGAGESAERALERDGQAVSRIAEELELGSDRARRAFERAVREDGRRLVSMLSESGIASVFFFGGDRGLLRRPDSGSLVVAGSEPLVALALSGVVPVVGTAYIDRRGQLSDVHPIRVAQSFAKKLQDENHNIMVRMVFTVPKIPGELAKEPGSARVPASDGLWTKGLDLSDSVVSMLMSGGGQFAISAPSGIGDVSQIRVGV